MQLDPTAARNHAYEHVKRTTVAFVNFILVICTRWLMLF